MTTCEEKEEQVSTDMHSADKDTFNARKPLTKTAKAPPMKGKLNTT